MDILTATKFYGFMDKGGSTKPWNVALRNFNGEEFPYIVKPFKRSVNQQQAATAKEFYGNLLAKEFDLSVPDCAIADFSEQFIKDALGKNEKKILKSKDPALKFASRYIEGAPIFSPLLHKHILKDYDFAKVYAFDFLCYNLDRGGFRKKNNILIDDDNFLLIDHEQTFPFIDQDSAFLKVLENLKNETTYYQYQMHVFFPYLKQLKTKTKKTVFDEFDEYLNRLNYSTISNAGKQLNSLGINIGKLNFLIDYLGILKQNRKAFCNVLIKSIT